MHKSQRHIMQAVCKADFVVQPLHTLYISKNIPKLSEEVKTMQDLQLNYLIFKRKELQKISL